MVDRHAWQDIDVEVGLKLAGRQIPKKFAASALAADIRTLGAAFEWFNARQDAFSPSVLKRTIEFFDAAQAEAPEPKAKPEATSPPVDAATLVQLEHLAKIRDLNKRLAEARDKYLRSKEVASKDKKVWDDYRDQLSELIAEDPRQMSLGFDESPAASGSDADDIDATDPDVVTHANTATPAATGSVDESWRDTRVAELGLTQAQLSACVDNGLVSVGAFVDFLLADSGSMCDALKQAGICQGDRVANQIVRKAELWLQERNLELSAEGVVVAGDV